MKVRIRKSQLILKDPLILDKMIMESLNLKHHYGTHDIKVEELEKAITKLNDVQRSCLEMFYFVKKSYKEIAIETGFEVKHVKSHIQNGKRNLKNILTQSKRNYNE